MVAVGFHRCIALYRDLAWAGVRGIDEGDVPTAAAASPPAGTTTDNQLGLVEHGPVSAARPARPMMTVKVGQGPCAGPTDGAQSNNSRI